MQTETLLASISLCSSLLTLLLFALDKSRSSRRGARRIPERTLLLLALIGGTPGAYAGRWLFRHKTRKQPFVGRLHAIAVVQGVALAGWWVWALTPLNFG